MAIAINATAWLTLIEAKAWCKIDPAVTAQDDVISRLINTACARIEKYLDAPVITREFAEPFDGTSSNVIVPSYGPVTEIVEVRVDGNGVWGDETAVDSTGLSIRGLPSMKNPVSPAVEIRGTDIVLRSDNDIVVLGRINSGSSVQSILIRYVAGLGETEADLPEDLVTATLMYLDYLYMLKENRDIAIKSKGTMGGQTYSKADIDEETGFPKEILSMIQAYKDYALPAVGQPQRNSIPL